MRKWIVDDAGDHLAVSIGGQTGGTMLQPQDNAEGRKAMGEVGGAVERIDVPAVLALHLVAGSLFAVDAVGGKGRLQLLANQLLAGAVGLGDEIDVALVLGGYTLFVKLPEQSTGLSAQFRPLRVQTQI